MTSLFRRAPLVSVVLAAALTACGTSKISEGPIDYGSPKAENNRLDVPPDLSKLPNNQNRYAIPGEVVSAKRVTQSQGAVVSELAPNQLGDVRFHREGAQAWLSIEQPIERVWPVVHAFWQENGFTFTTDDPQTGILETEWAENRAKLPQDFVRKTLGKVFDMLASTGERDKFRTRIERTAKGVDIFVSHRGLEEVYSNKDQTQTKWQPRATDPFLENEFLRRLMVKLGAPKDVAQATVNDKPDARLAELRQTDGQSALTYQKPLNQAWRHVGLTLDRLGFTIQDRDASRGLYFIRYIDPRVKEEPGFFKNLFKSSKKPQFPSEFRLQLSEFQGGTLIQVFNNQGQPDASEGARQIAQKLFESLR